MNEQVLFYSESATFPLRIGFGENFKRISVGCWVPCTTLSLLFLKSVLICSATTPFASANDRILLIRIRSSRSYCIHSFLRLLPAPAINRMAGNMGAWNFLQILICSLSFMNTEALYVGITYLRSAVAKGAVCLDGSPPAYHLHRGSGTGINSWLVHMEGGGWCNDVESCLLRKNARLGSSSKMVKQLPFSGILSNNPEFNPDFYNWNRVKVGYCDGSSFTGDVEAVNPVTKLHFRGARIWLAVMEELLAKGMANADNAILSGCSAGGLTSILHCDSFRALLPMGTNVKCLSDAGYFVNVPDVSRARHIESYFHQITELHGSVRNLPSYCTTKSPRPHLCFFPQYMAKQIRTPLFLLNAAYDSWQIKNILAPVAADPSGDWSDCKLDIKNCSPLQIRAMQEFRSEFLHAVVGLGRSESRGLFINSCYAHCQTETQETWFGPDSPKLVNTTIAEAVGDWFYDRVPFQRIDCPYPCDRSCRSRVFIPEEQP